MPGTSTLNVKFSNSQLKKLRPGIKNGIEIVLKLSSSAILMMRIIFHIDYY